MAMTQYLERSAVVELLYGRTDEPARLLTDAVAAEGDVELVAVDPIDPPTMVDGYEARLQWSESPDGPETLGLREFVDCLREDDPAELFAITIESTT